MSKITNDGFAPSIYRAALMDDRSFASPSTYRATIDRWRSVWHIIT